MRRRLPGSVIGDYSATKRLRFHARAKLFEGRILTPDLTSCHLASSSVAVP